MRLGGYFFTFGSVFRPTDCTDGHRCSVLSCVFFLHRFDFVELKVLSNYTDFFNNEFP